MNLYISKWSGESGICDEWCKVHSSGEKSIGWVGSPGPCFQYKDCQFRYDNPIIKIRQSWDRHIFIMVTPTLVRRHIYIDAVPRFLRADSRFPPSQWETSLQSNAVSHWLGANLESALFLTTWNEACDPLIGCQDNLFSDCPLMSVRALCWLEGIPPDWPHYSWCLRWFHHTIVLVWCPK